MVRNAVGQPMIGPTLFKSIRFPYWTWKLAPRLSDKRTSINSCILLLIYYGIIY